MLNVIIVSLLAVIYFISLFGCGHLIERIFRIRWSFPLTSCLGMAGWIFFGGILNLLGIAYPMALDIIVLFGLAYSALTFLQSWNLKSFPNYRSRYFSKDYLTRLLPSAALIVIVFIFTAYTMSSPQAYNWHDDLEKYISHPIRMLATGSLRAGPFDVLGGETLGGQAFLHGFAIAHFPIRFINTVDTVFALALCLMSVLAVALRVRLPFWFIPLVVMIPVFINPQIVNISAIYTASALMLFLFLGTWIRVKDHKHVSSPWSHALCLGLVYSSLIVLKTTFLFPVAIHFFLLLLGFIYISCSWKDFLSWTSKIVAATIIFTSPWIIVYYSNWHTLLYNTIQPPNSSVGIEYYRYTKQVINLFSLDPLFYGFGETFAHYTFTVILVVVFFLISLMYRHPNKQVYKTWRFASFAAYATLPILYFFSIVLIAPNLFGPGHALRYVCPVIIAAVPSALIMLTTQISESVQMTNSKTLSFKQPILILAFFSITLLGAFYGSFAERVKQAFQYGSILSFHELATDPEYIEYNHFALSADGQEKVQKAQQTVPEGEYLVAWTPLALHLDYRRNHIIGVNPGGLVNLWLDFPFSHKVDDGVKYFSNLGARYVLWQYSGYAVRNESFLKKRAASPFINMRTMGIRNYQFVKVLSNMAKQSQVIYNDGSILVLRLPNV